MSHADFRGMHDPRLRLQWSLMTFLSASATIAWLCGAVAVAQRVDAVRPSGGTWVTAGAAMFVVYYWRFQIASSEKTRVAKCTMFTVVLAVLLPYIYWSAGLIADWARLPLSKWVGDPVWVYAVPIVSFALFDLRRQAPSRRTYLIRNAAEMIVLIPAWTYTWIIAQQRLGWWWM